MKYFFLFLLSSIILFSCQNKSENSTHSTTKQKVDLIVYNAQVYTVDQTTPKAQAFAVKDGKFIEVGTNEEIQNKFESTEKVDAQGKTILPGLIDAHCHFYNLGMKLQQVDLVGTTSYQEVLDRIVAFQKEKNAPFIVGRGWDQNDWEEKEFPTNKELTELFPDTPVAITRIDGHAMIANQKALELAKITTSTKVEGGEIIQKNGKLTGILVDNPMELVREVIPQPSRQSQIEALLEAQKINFSYGLTTLDDAGLSPDIISLIDSLQKTNQLQMRMYIMVSNRPEYVEEYLKKGTYKTEKLNVSSFKVYADGALGSRGAALKEPYSDKENHHGAMLIGYEDLQTLAKKLANSDFQMNTHAIGDSANAVIIRTYYDALKGQKDRRWRIEHAQVVAPEEFEMLDDNLMMSVQPTHATSDMYWAEDRLGEERIKGAYAYKQLLEKTGKVALGTDYPVEQVNPFHTFYAAVARKDLKNYPDGGFQKQNALTREETLKGMTIWAAYSNFEENEKGSISAGKYADFVILDQDIMTVEEDAIPNTKAVSTYLGGLKVYGE
ncbi:amidohydrolase [Bernardetia sp. Wsw4-3y2]|uniref:amidohydrolase n=1 Tax=Bernardetia sp. Wsw4-3y2 TaxID=3127471 RepID=UPI0030CB6516